MRLSIIAIILLFFSNWVHAAEVADKGFALFWQEFKQAVINNDKVKIVSLTHFPFEVHGGDDSEAIKVLDKKGFINIYERLIVQAVYFPSGNEIVSKPLREVIYESKEIPESNVANVGNARFQQFEFERRNGKWRFVRAFLEE